MKKLSLDILGITALALIVCLVILVWGKELGIATADARSIWIPAVAMCSLVLAFSLTFDNRARLGSAARSLARWLHIRAPQTDATTQGALAKSKNTQAPSSNGLSLLREHLRVENGMRWRYRQSWLLLTGDDATIEKSLPDLVFQGWLATQDAVLLWSKTDRDGRPDGAWLQQLYALRRNRPLDAVILTLDGNMDLSLQRATTNVYGVMLARIANALRWSAPVYVLDVAQTDAFNNGRTAALGCEFAPGANERSIESSLLQLRSRIGHMSVGQLIRSYKDRYSAQLSERLDTRSAPLAALIASLANRKERHRSVSGAFFAPFPVAVNTRTAADSNELTSADLPLWRHLAAIARKQRGRRMGWHPATVFSTIALTVIGIWTAGMLISGMSNGRSLSEAQQTIQTLKTAPDPAARLQALLALQQQIGRYEDRVAHQPPLWTRFGLNQDTSVLAALWPPYAAASKAVLVTPIQQNLEATLVDLSQMQTDSLDDHANAAALDGHKALKTYLMLADPSRVDASFITPQLVRFWSTNANVSVGAKLDISERLAGFYAQHLKAHDAWRIQPRADLVNASRQTLLSVIGVRNSEDTVYQSVLAGMGNKYPDQTLASLTAGTDTRGLIRTSVTVPGVYTRQAYEGHVAAAIAQAAKSRDVTRDWVLVNNEPSANPVDAAQVSSTDALELALTTQYFNDYAEHWQGFMNALQWQPAPNVPAAIEQMKLLTDARQSPVIALMKSLDYQGTAGTRQASLSDTLVAKAQNMFGKKDAEAAVATANASGPLSASFGPVLRLIGRDGDSTAKTGAPASDVSLQRYLERVTALRLKLQQLSNGTDGDAQARQLAQALFQGKGSELADTQAYAQLIAASLGAQWSGMGDALFVRPVAQATQIVLQPAQASLNDAWRQTIVANWNKSFTGRYPFNNTDNDASIPELARFIRPQGGLISTFLSLQLAGVLELQGDQWVETNTRGGALQFDPAFIKAVNMLQRVAGHLLAQGEPQYRFDFKPIPTPGITDTVLTIDAQKLHYYNQRETWQGLVWPSNDPETKGTRLQWQTEQAGTNKNFEFGGRWALVRMLERAKVEPVDSATFQLTWQAAPDTRMMRMAAAASPSAASSTSPTAQNPSHRAGDDWNGSVQEQSASTEHLALDSLVTQEPLTAPPTNLTYPLSYLMRTDVGKGPLELLALKGFVLPNRMFIDKPARVANISTSASPPPLPKAARDAAKHAVTPLPDVAL
ncbi:ImcF-related family protein [Caballeronia sordidicola]|uniref:ImcF-related family protein n=1 Tax=Caballeronia sordidicola TaxID=196367 RepID=UPI0004CFFAF6|nr:ImcF-related family protein [Caballeronia sordidicola]